MRSPRGKSPSYPGLDLQTAVGYVREAGKTSGKMSTDVMLKALGFTSSNGRSKMVVNSLKSYELIVEDGDMFKFSDMSLSLAGSRTGVDQCTAMKTAALKPEILKELSERFRSDELTDGRAREFLEKSGYLPSAVERIISVHSKNMDLLESGGLRTRREVIEKAESPAVVDHQVGSQASKQGPGEGLSGSIFEYTLESGAEIQVVVQGIARSADIIKFLSAWIDMKKAELGP